MVAVGCALIPVLLAVWRPHAGELLPFLAFASAGLIAQSAEVRLPLSRGVHSRIVSPSSAPYLAAILVLSPPLAVLVAAAGVAVSSLTLRRRVWFKGLFNVGQYSLSVGISALLWRAMVPYPTGPQWPEHVVPMMLTAAGYFALNTGLVSAMVGMAQNRSVWEAWRQGRRGMLPSYLGMLFVGVLIAVLWAYNPWSTILTVVPLAGIFIALKNASRFEDQSARLRTLARVSQVVSSTLDQQRVLDSVVAGALDLAGASEARLWLLKGEDSRDLFLAAVACSPGHDPGSHPESLEEKVRDALATGEAQRCTVGSAEFLGVPVALQDRRLGVLAVLTDGRQPSTDEDLDLMRSLASQAAIAIENARLFQEVGTVEALREMARLKSEFLSLVSHELRTPLSVIYGFAELLRTRVPSPAQSREMGREIHEAARHMMRLVDDLLDTSRMETGRFSLNLCPTDLGQLLTSVAASFSRNDRDHPIRVELPPGLPLVRVDPERIRQVVSNLLTNAIRYSPKGVPITVRAGVGESRVWFEVEDRGMGIEPGELGYIFDKFYRTRAARAAGVGGTGLGLAIVKSLVEAHGGEVNVQSAVGQGARFTVYLPLGSK